MENMGIKKFVSELNRLNPSIKFRVSEQHYSTIVVDASKGTYLNVTVPAGYYLDGQYVTNKHNTDTGLYEQFLFEAAN